MPKLNLSPTIGEFWITGGSTIEVPAGAISIVSSVDPTTGIRIDSDAVIMTVAGVDVMNIGDTSVPLSVENFTDYELLVVADDDIPNKKYVDDAILGGMGAVSSVFTRTGAVISASGDYTAAQITNVPSGSLAATDVQGALNEVNVEKSRWLNGWTEIEYLKNDMVRDGAWTMIANKTTSERAAPQPNGDPVTSLPDVPTWATLSNISVIQSGHLYDFTQNGWLRSLRIWAPELTSDIHYRIIIVDETNPSIPIVNIIEEQRLNENDWTVVAVGSLIIPIGTKLRIVLDAYNSSADTTFSHQWTSDGEQGSAAPSNESWNRRKQDDIVRIDKDDLTSTDRTVELLSVIPDTTINCILASDVSKYRTFSVISDPIDQGTYVEYSVVKVDDTDKLDSGTTTIDFTVPITASTKYVSNTTFWSLNPVSFATVTGFLEFDGVDQPGNSDTAFGVDVEFQPASVSADWDFVAVSDISASGGTGSSASHLPVYTVATLPAVTIGGLIYVTDETGGPTPAHSNGVSWFRTSDNAIVS